MVQGSRLKFRALNVLEYVFMKKMFIFAKVNPEFEVQLAITLKKLSFVTKTSGIQCFLCL